MASVGFRVFAMLWAIVHLVELLSLTYFWTASPPGYFVAILSFWVLWNPDSVASLAALCAVSNYKIWMEMPFIPNHVLLEFLQNSLVLAAAFQAFIKRGGGAECFRDFARPVRLQVILIYHLAFLQKLNWDFLNPESSCATLMYYQIVDQLPLKRTILPFSLVGYLTVYGALITEAAIPTLLMIPRTRHVGCLLGFAFHTLLGFHQNPGAFGFSIYMMPALFLFLSSEAVSSVGTRLFVASDKSFDVTMYRSKSKVWILSLVINWAFGFFMRLDKRKWKLREIMSERVFMVAVFLHKKSGHIFWLLCTLWMVWHFVMACTKTNSGMVIPGSKQRVGLFITFSMMAFNAANPHIGGKTHMSLSMFSNLKTELNPNHLFIKPLRLMPYQDDMIKIINMKPSLFQFQGWIVNPTSIHHLYNDSRDNWVLPLFELRRLVNMYKKPLQVVFEYQDGRRVVATRDSQGNESPSFVFEAPSYWEEKFVWMYRRNSFDGPNMCDRERQRYQSQN